MCKKVIISVWSRFTAPFRVLKIEKIYAAWLFILVISFAGCIVDFFNGDILANLEKGILFSTCFAVVAPFLIEFAIDLLNKKRSKASEHFWGYKAWMMILHVFTLFILFSAYMSDIKGNIIFQTITTAVLGFLSFYTYLVNKMEQHVGILTEYQDKPYDEVERIELEKMQQKAKAIDSITGRNGNEVKL